jgi:hypothetical protein
MSDLTIKPNCYLLMMAFVFVHDCAGPLFQPRVAILSLGGDAILRFSRAGADAPCASAVMRSGSLLVFEAEAYTQLWHRIDNAMYDVVDDTVMNVGLAGCTAGSQLSRPERRLSLTLRRLSQVTRRFGAFEVLTPDEEAEQKRRSAWWLSSISEKDIASRSTMCTGNGSGSLDV